MIVCKGDPRNIATRYFRLIERRFKIKVLEDDGSPQRADVDTAINDAESPTHAALPSAASSSGMPSYYMCC
eukprot:6578999-Pyramimonas_sp.AAC.3